MPCLNAEKQLIAASMNKVQTKTNMRMTSLQVRRNANMSRTIGDINPNQDGDIDGLPSKVENNQINGDSALDQYTT